MNASLKSRSVIATGAGQGIGKTMARGLACIARFLACSESDDITGQSLMIGGGMGLV